MLKAVCVAFLVGALLLLCTGIQAKNYTGDAFVGRWWTVQPNATYFSNDVVLSFYRGLAPELEVLPGFQEYVGSSINCSDTFFFNTFENTADATKAQATAKAFVANSSELKNQIELVEFFQGNYSFFLTNGNASKSEVGNYLSFRYWQVNANATQKAEQIVDTFQVQVAPTLRLKAGFLEYAGIIQDPEHLIFYNVFDNIEEAKAANEFVLGFVANGTLSAQITRLVAFTAGIDFDILAVANTTAPANSTATH